MPSIDCRAARQVLTIDFRRAQQQPAKTSWEQYVRQCLLSTLKRGIIVLMDNLPVHKVAGVVEASKPRAQR